MEYNKLLKLGVAYKRGTNYFWRSNDELVTPLEAAEILRVHVDQKRQRKMKSAESPHRKAGEGKRSFSRKSQMEEMNRREIKMNPPKTQIIIPDINEYLLKQQKKWQKIRDGKQGI